MELKYNGVDLPSQIIEFLIDTASELNIPPSYLITKLHFEGVWGSSKVARSENNWAGMSMPSNEEHLKNVTRPSGVVVTKGGKRPVNEGGHYYKYATLDDFFKDWTYLIRRGGIYNVADNDFDSAVLGMFRYGGAKADYATMDIPESSTASKVRSGLYLKRMQERHLALNNANDGALDKLDQEKGVDNMTVTATQLLTEAKKYMGVTKYSSAHKALADYYNTQNPLPRGTRMQYDWDWCAMFVSVTLMRLGLAKEYGTEMSVGFYKQKFIDKKIWKGVVKPQPGDIVIWQWDGSKTAWPDHIGFVLSVSGNNIVTIEGNTTKNGVSCVGSNTYPYNSMYIQGYARIPFGQSTTTPVKTMTFEQAVLAVISGSLGTGSERISNIKNVGQDAVKVQAEVNKRLTKPVVSAPTKSKSEVADEVIKGLWGFGKERVDKLTKSGFNANEIQKLVNDKIKPIVDFSGHKNKIVLTKDLIILDKVNGTRRGTAISGTIIKFDEVYIDNGLFIAYLNGNGDRCYIKVAEVTNNKVGTIDGVVSKS